MAGSLPNNLGLLVGRDFVTVSLWGYMHTYTSLGLRFAGQVAISLMITSQCRNCQPLAGRRIMSQCQPERSQ